MMRFWPRRTTWVRTKPQTVRIPPMQRIVPLTIAILSSALAGCAATSRVNGAVTPADLTTEQKAVVIMRIGAASPACQHVAVLLGTPDGSGFRRHSVLQVMNVHSLVDPAMAEAELGAGTYHVVGYSCHDGRKPGVVADKADHGTYRTSYAAFSVSPGEIVNVGFLHFHAAKVGANAFGRAIKTDVTVTDWPLVELDRFKQKRPRIFARMVTRLMTVTENHTDRTTPQDCARLAALRTEGKVQAMPAACQRGAVTPDDAGRGASKTGDRKS